jgi:nucleoside phosphorylase
MIVVVGDTYDDVLYFDTVLANKKEKVILNRFKVSVGTIFSQDVIVLRDMSTSVLTSAVLCHILDNYYVDLVIGVGKCLAVSKDFKAGNIALSSNVIDANVDLSIFKDVGMAQIPGFSREFSVQEDIFGYLSQNLEKRPGIDHYGAVYLSTDNMSRDMLTFLKENKTLFFKSDERFVIDHNSAGIAVACALKDVPFIITKVVETSFDQSQNLATYTNVLSRYIDLGKGIISTINDIGRSDILEGEEDERR